MDGISTRQNSTEHSSADKSLPNVAKAARRRLPDERRGITHHFSVGGQEGYITVGVYDDGTPGEIFIVMAKEGSMISGLMDGLATVVSLALQYGIPLELLCSKLSYTRFEPSGWTGNPDIGFANSILDYLARWLEIRFVKPQQQLFSARTEAAKTGSTSQVSNTKEAEKREADSCDAPCCNICGTLMSKSGSCFRCPNCFQTSGCS